MRDEECLYGWDAPYFKYNGPHVCVKPIGHTQDITNDDHRCCCGATGHD
jgi:hypothetical protein